MTFGLSFVFWRLDCRNRELIDYGESALKALERLAQVRADGKPSVVSVFSREAYATEGRRWHIGYKNCLNGVFLIFGFLGILIAALLGPWPDWY